MSRTATIDHLPARAPTYTSDAPPPIEIDHLPPRWTPTPPRPSLPVGVAVMSVLVALAGLVIVVSGILILLNSAFGAVVPASLFILSSVDLTGAAILVALGGVLIVVGSALWHQETWALWTTIVVLFASLTYLFFTASITILFLLLLLLFIYLLSVRHHFY